MAWTAKVAAKDNIGGRLNVNVEYTDGVQKFTEVFGLTGGDVEGAKARVRAKLATLAASDSLFATIPVGFSNFAAAADPAPTAKDIFIAAMRTFQKWLRAVDLGLATKADVEYVNAQQAMISAWNTSLIDSV